MILDSLNDDFRDFLLALTRRGVPACLPNSVGGLCISSVARCSCATNKLQAAPRILQTPPDSAKCGNRDKLYEDRRLDGIRDAPR